MKKTPLKKVIILALAVCAVLAVCACGGEKDVTMKLGEKVTVDGYVEVTPLNVLVSDKIYPPISRNYAMGWTASSGKTYAAVVAKVRNLQEEAIKASELCAFRLTAGGDTFDQSTVGVLSGDDMNLSGSGSIKSGGSATVYFITEIDEDAVNPETLAEFAFTRDDGEPVYNYKLDIDTTKRVAIVKKLEQDKKISAEGFCELTPKNIKFAKKIMPPSPSGYYNFFQANGADERLLVVTMKTRNLTKTKQYANAFYGITVIYDGKAYIGGVVSDDANKANVTQYERIPSGTVRTTYGTASLPKEAADSKCEVYIYVDGAYYQYTYDK